MLYHQGTLQLEANRVILRKFIEDDATSMYQNCTNDDEVTKYISSPTHKELTVTETCIKKWIDNYNDEFYHWAIVLKESAEAIGVVTVENISNSNEHCEIGYYIGKAFWGKGIVTEVLKAAITFLFDEVGFQRIGAIHHSENVASGKVLIKVGMRHEGVMRKLLKNKSGVFVDCDLYSIVRDDRREY